MSIRCNNKFIFRQQNRLDIKFNQCRSGVRRCESKRTNKTKLTAFKTKTASLVSQQTIWSLYVITDHQNLTILTNAVSKR